MQTPQTTTRRRFRQGHLARTLTMASLTIAMLLGLFGVGGVGPKAVQDLFVEDAAAAGNCSVWAQVKTGVYNGRYVVYGYGYAYCSLSADRQSLTVELYANGTLVRSNYASGKYNPQLAVWTYSVYLSCGVQYQVKVIHNHAYESTGLITYIHNETTTTHLSQPFKHC